MEKILIKGGRIVDPAQGVDMVGDLLLSEGKVAGLEKSVPSDNGTRVVDAAGMVVSPGFIDLHCHLREPGFRIQRDDCDRYQGRRDEAALRPSARCQIQSRPWIRGPRWTTCWKRRGWKAQYGFSQSAALPRARWVESWRR